MNKFLAFLVGCSLAFSTVTTYKLLVSKNRDVVPLSKKFGTWSTKPKLTPIVHLTNEFYQPFCTAFVVDANYAVTAAHCVDSEGHLSEKKYRFLNEMGQDDDVEVTAVGYDKDTDLGLLTGDFNNFINLKVDFNNMGFFPGKPMYACGFPFGQHTLACNMIIPVNNEDLAIRSLGFLRNGMSGGPVIDINTGIAYGVNFAIDDGHSYVNSLQGLLGIFHIE